jgi:hypothetical protein
MRRSVASSFVSIALLLSVILSVRSHEHHGDSSCEMDPNVRVLAEYRGGIVTVDGQLDDWDSVDGSEFELRPALDPDEDKKYQGGKITVKV